MKTFLTGNTHESVHQLHSKLEELTCSQGPRGQYDLTKRRINIDSLLHDLSGTEDACDFEFPSRPLHVPYKF
jgi:hypothetical protein